MGNVFGNKNKKCLMFGLRDSGKTTILYKLKLGEVFDTKSTIAFHNETVEYKRITWDIFDIGWIFHENNLYDPNNIKSLDIKSIKINESTIDNPWSSYNFTEKVTSRHGKESDLKELKEIYLKYDTSKLFKNVRMIIIVIDCNNKYSINHSKKYISEIPTDDDGFLIKPSLRQIMIVAGYCKDNEKEYNLNIPNGIIDICLRYYALHQSVKDLLDFILGIPQWKDVPILFLLNKQDLPNALSVSQSCDELNLWNTMKGRNWYAQSSCAITGDGLYEGVDWMTDQLEKK